MSKEIFDELLSVVQKGCGIRECDDPCEACLIYESCLCSYGNGNACKDIAEALYNAGYRKQSEGEWHTVVDNKNDIVTECTACKKQFWFMKKGQLNIDRMPFCPNCGAKMKGGAE